MRMREEIGWRKSNIYTDVAFFMLFEAGIIIFLVV